MTNLLYFCSIKHQFAQNKKRQENGDITKDIVVNEAPFDEKLAVFSSYMLPLANYIDTIHGVIDPNHSIA